MQIEARNLSNGVDTRLLVHSVFFFFFFLSCSFAKEKNKKTFRVKTWDTLRKSTAYV